MIVLISNGFLVIQNDAICSVRNSYTVAKRLHLANKKSDFCLPTFSFRHTRAILFLLFFKTFTKNCFSFSTRWTTISLHLLNAINEDNCDVDCGISTVHSKHPEGNVKSSWRHLVQPCSQSNQGNNINLHYNFHPRSQGLFPFLPLVSPSSGEGKTRDPKSEVLQFVMRSTFTAVQITSR